ncbi:MAG: ABC transporter ATP-binding protein [Muribaculaceae bacterium]|nr:ABC transporter ATP-binding protein [Muribaculaceae bacterium]MBR5171441.1 ABC transporter ATP-binding protein [Muribaculaceae bacterium]
MLKTLLKQIGTFKTASILTPIFIALEVVMGVLIPYVTSWIIDEGIADNDLGDVYKYGAIMLVLAAMSMIFGILAGRFSAMASSGFARNLRDAMFRNIQTFSFSNIDKFSSSGLVTRMTTDVNNLQNAFQMLLRVSVRAPLNLIFSIFMCVFINTKMSLIFVIALVILGTVLYLIISRTVKLFTQVFKKYDDLNNVVQENVSAIRVVKAFVREDYENKKFSKAARGLYKLFVKTESLMALNHPVMMVVVYGCIIALSWFGAKQIVSDNLTTGQLTSLFTYVMTILSALMMLSMIFVQLTMSAASGKRVAEVINEKADITNPENPVMTVADGSIDFEDVKFSYQKTASCSPSKIEIAGVSITDVFNAVREYEYAISDINLHIASGETIGIIGGTGCGKSTLAMLISRMYDVSEGSIKVGGVDVRDYDLETLRNNVSMVLQKNVLFSGTVLDNLRWGKTDATLEECKHACKLACADEFIEEMPNGYDTVIEQGGANVSGGQKQRLCIARALLKNPKVLVLDDSTSACDTATAASISKALSDYMPDVTKVIVAQRVHSVMNANRIIVMDNGHITGFDTHENLLKTNDIYREIYTIQTQDSGDFDKPK